MEPLEVVLQLLDSLTEEEQAQVRERLGELKPKQLSPCRKSGHKYRPLRHVEADWWKGVKEHDELYCERCGVVRSV